jgi:hypothetical protein
MPGQRHRNQVTAQQHNICFAASRCLFLAVVALGLLMCKAALRRALPRICGSSEAALLNSSFRGFF